MEQMNITPEPVPEKPQNKGQLQMLRLSGSGAFALVVLMFFFTFCFLKCNQTKMVKFSGIDLAFGLEGKPSDEMKSLGDMGGKGKDIFGSGNSDGGSTSDPFGVESSPAQKSKGFKQKYGVYNVTALAALLLGVVSLVISLLPSHKTGIIAFISGLGIVVFLLMCQVLFQLELKDPGKTGNEWADKIKITLEFTLAYWIAILMALAGAVIGLIRFLQAKKTTPPPPVPY